MKVKKNRIKRISIGRFLYWIQVIPMLPILMFFSFLWAIGESVCQYWTNYRKWFLSLFKTKSAQ